jgi:hypothetical protein
MGDGRLLVVVVGEKMSFDEAGPHEAVGFVPVQGDGLTCPFMPLCHSPLPLPLPLRRAVPVLAAFSVVLEHLDRHRMIQFPDHLDRPFTLEVHQMHRSQTGERGRDPVSFLLARAKRRTV